MKQEEKKVAPPKQGVAPPKKPPVDMNFEFIKRIPGMPDQFFRSKPVPPEPPKRAGKVVKKQATAKD